MHDVVRSLSPSASSLKVALPFYSSDEAPVGMQEGLRFSRFPCQCICVLHHGMPWQVGTTFGMQHSKLGGLLLLPSPSQFLTP
jgi:hypothetical protein